MIWLGRPTSNKCAARSRLCWFWGELVERRKLCAGWVRNAPALFEKHQLLFVSTLPPVRSGCGAATCLRAALGGHFVARYPKYPTRYDALHAVMLVAKDAVTYEI